jgi:hypothetical protein
MWYSFIKTSISKEEAEKIIQQELDSRTFVDLATDDENLIKQKLIEKYGSEENMVAAINEEVAKIMSSNEFGQSSPFVRGSSETHSHFSTPYEAFYVLPNGTVTPNLQSHVRFDKYLLSRLGINPEALKDRSDRHILSELTGAMRINYQNGSVNATIYTNPSAQQLEWLKNNDVSRSELDIRRGTEVQYGEPTEDKYTEALSSLSEMGIREFYDQLDKAKEYLRTVIGSVETTYDERYRPVNKAENPNNLPEDQVEKLTKIYVNLNDAETSLFNVTEILSDI